MQRWSILSALEPSRVIAMAVIIAVSCHVTVDAAPPVTLNPDLDGDRTVGVHELNVLTARWQSPEVFQYPDHTLDLDGDGIVGGGDVGAVLAGWGSCSSWPILGARLLRLPAAADLQAADFDNDGRVDLILRTHGDILHFVRNVGVEHDGGSKVARLDAWTVPSFPARRFRVADMNGDGLVEVITDFGQQGWLFAVRWEAGSWQLSALTSGLPQAIDDFQCVDVDGDGALDVVVKPAGLAKAVVWRQDKDRTFSPTWTAEWFDGGTSFLRTGDVDDDGLVDLVAVVSGSNPAIWVFAGSERAPSWPGVSWDAGYSEVSGVAIGNVDGVGGDDLVLAGRIQFLIHGATVHLSSPEGGFDAAPVQIASQNMRLLAVADVDGNGHLDVIGALGLDPARGMGTILQTGPMVFAPSVIGATGGLQSALVVADLEGTGEPTVAMTVLSEYGNGNNALELHRFEGGAPTPQEMYGDELGTFDPSKGAQTTQGQATPAIAVKFQATKLATTFFSEGAPTGWTVHTLPSAIRDVAYGDLDNDGVDDLVVAAGGELRTSRRQADGSMGEWQVWPMGSAGDAGRLALADLDGDRFMDAAWTVGVPAPGPMRGVWIAKGDGVGGFMPPLQVLTASGLTALGAGDLDGDGDTDLAAAGTPIEGVDGWLLLQTSPGAFTSSPVWTGLGGVNGDEADTVQLADLDGDGDDDIVIRSQLSPTGNVRHSIVRVERGGISAVEHRDTVWLSSYPGATDLTRLGDLNGDGLPELVQGGRRRVAEIHWNTGTSFHGPHAISDGSWVATLFLIDVEGDGDLDIVNVSPSGWTWEATAQIRVTRDRR